MWTWISLGTAMGAFYLASHGFPKELVKIGFIASIVFLGLAIWHGYLYWRYLGSIKRVLSYWSNLELVWSLQTSLLNAKTTGAIASHSYRVLPRIWVYREKEKFFFKVQKIPGSFEEDLDHLSELVGATLGDRWEVVGKALDPSGTWFELVFGLVNQHLRFTPKVLGEIPQPAYTLKLMNGVSIDLTSLPHLAIFGLTGSRKTSTLLAFIAEVLPTSDVYFLDGKGEFSVLSSFIPADHFASSEDKILNLLSKLIKIMKKRAKFVNEEVQKRGVMGLTAKKVGLKPIFLVVDEYASVKASFKKPKDLDSLMLQALMQFRAYGIFVLYASQSPNSKVLPVQMREEFGTYILLGTANDDTQRMAFGEVATTGTVPLGSGFYLTKTAQMPTPQRFEVPDFYKYGLNGIETMKKLYEMGHKVDNINKILKKG
ncbi:FtsK/SpoIIIE domain-containing protein [Lactobacillus taiwanensis]|uniref:FtsK/SpoIIIE domain-containing protein n=2 Tax=Lactobacillus taiwanensis TaxID=508451 RepID=UPI00164A9D3C|nr:FtsK/SpoIIIE domain-containing protein [Lactobacillus taiwanensis]